MSRRSSLALAFLLLPLLATAQPIFTMDYGTTSGGWPGTVPQTVTHTVTRQPTGGPDGQGAFDLIQRVALSAPGFGGDRGGVEPGGLEFLASEGLPGGELLGGCRGRRRSLNLSWRGARLDSSTR